MQPGPICLLILIPFLASCSRQSAVKAKEDGGPIKVRVAPVISKELRREVEAVGSLFPFEEVTISSEIDGRVEEVRADLGDRVAPGQILVRISDEEQRYLLAQNEAQLQQSLQSLGLKNETDKVKDIRETPDVRRARAELFDAEQRYKRVRNLTEQGIGSRQDLDQAQARFQSVSAAYDTTLNQTRNLVQEVERTRAVVDLQRKKLRDTSVRAPFAANIKERLVNVGQYVRPNTPVFTLVKTDPIRMRIEVPERMAPWVKNGQTADVLLEAFPGRTFSGQIWRISPTVDQSKRTFLVEALIPNPSGELKPGFYAKAHVRTDKSDHIRLVPAAAVYYIFGANKIYVVNDGTIEAREVRIGDRVGDDVEIAADGVSDGEHVATSQLSKLETGTRVIAENEAARNGARKAD
jgi:RND family efflux transporter MFP subunit